MGKHGGVIDGDERLIRALSTFDFGLSANSFDKIIPACRCMPPLA
jgi:hypothetical protein